MQRWDIGSSEASTCSRGCKDIDPLRSRGREALDTKDALDLKELAVICLEMNDFAVIWDPIVEEVGAREGAADAATEGGTLVATGSMSISLTLRWNGFWIVMSSSSARNSSQSKHMGPSRCGLWPSLIWSHRMCNCCSEITIGTRPKVRKSRKRLLTCSFLLGSYTASASPSLWRRKTGFRFRAGAGFTNRFVSSEHQISRAWADRGAAVVLGGCGPRMISSSSSAP
eukprot:2930755-Rhodomonas_salina.2